MKAKLLAMAVMASFATSSGFDQVRATPAHTRRERPRQSDEERNEKLAKAEAKRHRKAEKNTGAKQ